MLSSVNNERMKRWNGIKMNLRQLGSGHWDRKLIKRMVEKSVSNDPEEAVREWKATGKTWWPGLSGNTPEWVSEHQNGPGYCLCGHTIWYHFEIINTETSERECVGSDHINAYMIARSIAEEMGITPEQVNDDEIQKWIKTRVKGMKADAWWEQNGEWWNDMLEGLREVDQYKNYVYTGENRWDSEYERSVRLMKPRKKAEGSPTSHNYQMASVFWRWDNQENSRNQITSRGYPNERLLADVIMLHTLYRQEWETEKERRRQRDELRLREIEQKRERQRQQQIEFKIQQEKRREEQKKREEENRILQAKRLVLRAKELDEKSSLRPLKSFKEFYGLEHFCSAITTRGVDLIYLYQCMQDLMSSNFDADSWSISRLKLIYNNKERATDEQITEIISLGGTITGPTNKTKASEIIKTLKGDETHAD